jgi:iron complex outermembrane receptor protein
VDGVVTGTGFDQLNGRINLTQKALKDKLTIDFNLSSTLRKEKYIPSEAFRYAVRFNPTAPVYDDTSAFGQEWGGYFQAQAFYHFNPVAITKQSKLDGKKYNIQGGLKGTYEIIDGLKVSAFYSLTATNELFGTYWSKYAYYTPYAVGSHKGYARKETNDNFDHLFELTGAYEKTIGKITFSLLGGYSYFNFTRDNFWAFGEGFLTDDFSYNNLGSASGVNANDETMSSYKEGGTLVGFFGRGTFNYDNGVFMTLNFRRDGASAFGANQKWGNFPGVSAGVDIARFVGIPYVDRLKLRGGYGITGNLPPEPYLSQLLYDIVEGGLFFYEGEYIQAYGPTRNANPDLKWETKKELGFGIDYALIDYRLSGSIDYYRSISSDLILFYRVPVPPYPAEYMWLNVGQLENSGLEFAISYKSPQSNKFNWSVDFNFTNFFETKLNKITSDISEGSATRYLGELGDPFLVGINSILVEEQATIGQIIAPIYTGIDSTGSLTFKDVNEDGKIDVNDYEVVGSGLPDFQLGLGGSISWKGFYANLFFRAVLGHSLVNVNNAKFGVPNVLGIQSGVEQAIDFIDATDGPVYSDVHVEKANFLRLDNWSLGYNFKIKENDYIEGLRVYLAGQNLFTLTNYSGVDPEVRYVDSRDNDNPLAPGIDRQQQYLMTRSFTLGVNLTF